MEQRSVYAGLVFFGFLFAPVRLLLSLFGNALSRRNEHAADAFAVATTGRPQSMVSALKRLSVDNLAYLTPHPFSVFLNYGHPPVLRRIKAIRALTPP